MLKIFIAVLILLTSGSVFAETVTPDQAQAPDFLYIDCVDVTDRVIFRALRNFCDDYATARGYTIGIFRPHKEGEGGYPPKLTKCVQETDKPIQFSCLGAPHQEWICPPDCG